jgi:hypothetical protein
MQNDEILDPEAVVYMLPCDQPFPKPIAFLSQAAWPFEPLLLCDPKSVRKSESGFWSPY